MTAHPTQAPAGPTSAQADEALTPPDPPAGVEPLGRRFAVHLTSVTLANLADGILLAGIPLIAVSLTRSPGQISMLSVAFWLPWLLLGILAGVIVDRTDRNRVRQLGMLVRAVLVGALGVLALTDQLSMPVLIVAVGLYGVTQVFVDLAGVTMVPQLAPRSRWSAANGRLLAAEQVSNTFVGAPLGGLLVVLGAGWVFGIPAALCVLFILLVMVGLRGPFTAVRPQPTRPMADLREGLKFLVRHPILRPLLVSGGVMNMANTAYFAVFVLWVVGEGSAVGMAPQHYPLLLAVLAVGALAGSLCTERLSRRWDEVPLMLTVWGVNTVMLLVPVLAPHPLTIGAAFLVLGFTNMVGNVLSQTLRQRLVPTAMLGRVGGTSRTIGYGLMPIGALWGGLVGEAWGLPVVFLGATAVAFLGLVYPLLTVRQHQVEALEVQ